MLVSKSSTELTPQQRNSLQAIFGDSAVLHTLRNRLAESERFGHNIHRLLDQYVKLSHSAKNKLNELWKQFSVVIKNMAEVPIDELNHYQLLVVKNLLVERYPPEKVAALEASLEADNVLHNEMRNQLTRAFIMEEASKGILEGVADGPSGIDLLSPSSSLIGKNQFARNKSTAEKTRKPNLMAFAEAHIQTAEKAMGRKRSTFRHKEMPTVQS